MQSQYLELRVGLVGLGLEAYWNQFAGLHNRLSGYLAELENQIAGPTRRVINLGLVDTPEKALDASHRCRREDIDILLVYITTYALSSTVLPLIKRAKVPVLLLNLQPEAAIDYARFNAMQDRTRMTGEAGLLRQLSGTGDRQRTPASGHSLPAGHRHAA
jgi:L-arabinose isomerase